MTGNSIRENTVVLSSGNCTVNEKEQKYGGKLSCIMAMILGIFCTVELMTAGAMLLNVDMRSVDLLAVFFVFVVLYFGIVAVLTD